MIENNTVLIDDREGNNVSSVEREEKKTRPWQKRQQRRLRNKDGKQQPLQGGGTKVICPRCKVERLDTSGGCPSVVCGYVVPDQVDLNESKQAMLKPKPETKSITQPQLKQPDPKRVEKPKRETAPKSSAGKPKPKTFPQAGAGMPKLVTESSLGAGKPKFEAELTPELKTSVSKSKQLRPLPKKWIAPLSEINRLRDPKAYALDSTLVNALHDIQEACGYKFEVYEPTEFLSVLQLKTLPARWEPSKLSLTVGYAPGIGKDKKILLEEGHFWQLWWTGSKLEVCDSHRLPDKHRTETLSLANLLKTKAQSLPWLQADGPDCWRHVLTGAARRGGLNHLVFVDRNSSADWMSLPRAQRIAALRAGSEEERLLKELAAQLPNKKEKPLTPKPTVKPETEQPLPFTATEPQCEPLSEERRKLYESGVHLHLAGDGTVERLTMRFDSVDRNVPDDSPAVKLYPCPVCVHEGKEKPAVYDSKHQPALRSHMLQVHGLGKGKLSLLPGQKWTFRYGPKLKDPLATPPEVVEELIARARATPDPFRWSGNPNVIVAPVMKGVHFARLNLRKPNLPTIAYQGLVTLVRQKHLSTMKMVQQEIKGSVLEELDLATALILALENLRHHHGWAWTTTDRHVGELAGGFSRLNQYAEEAQPVKLGLSNLWKDHARATAQRARRHNVKQARALTPEELVKAVELLEAKGDAKSRRTAEITALAWICAARIGCTTQLRRQDLRAESDFMTSGHLHVTFKGGKSVLLKKQSYTVHPFVEEALRPTLKRLLDKPLESGWLFPASAKRERQAFGDDVRLGLQAVVPEATQYSIRRGALQALAMTDGVSEEVLLEFSQHTTINSLRRYLNWGLLNKMVAERCWSAGEAGLNTAKSSAGSKRRRSPNSE